VYVPAAFDGERVTCRRMVGATESDPGGGLGRTLGLALGVALLLGVAAAGGSVVRASSTSATAKQALPYAAMGAIAAVALGAIVLIAIRAARPDSLRLRPLELLMAAFVLAALGALIGAALTPDTPEADDVSPLDQDEIDRRTEQTRTFDDRTRAGTVDRDGDGHADRDADGDIIVGYDIDGDGRLDGYLQPCPAGTEPSAPRPGYTPIDNDCDGTIDAWLPFDASSAPLVADQDDRPTPPVTISPEQRQERADSRGAAGQRGSTARNLLLILLVLAIGAAIVAYIVRMPDRDESSDDEPPDEPPHNATAAQPGPDLAASFEASLDAVLDDPDPRRAICAAYGRLLDGLADAGVPRRAEEAPEEHIGRCFVTARLDPAPTRELLDLFALARFSSHPISEHHRLAAVRAMRAALASAGSGRSPVAAGSRSGWDPPEPGRP
jgi:hypothetical protein